MDGNRNWPAWGALILAGLALMVALSGHFGGAGPVNEVTFAQPAYAPQGAPVVGANPSDAQMQAEAQQLQQQLQQLKDANQALQDKLQNQSSVPAPLTAPGSVPAAPAAPAAPLGKGGPSFAVPFKGGPFGWHGSAAPAGGPHFPFGGFFGFPFSFLGGLPQALLLAGLFWLAWRRFGPRRPRPAAQAAQAARGPALTKRLDDPDQTPPRSA